MSTITRPTRRSRDAGGYTWILRRTPDDTPECTDRHWTTATSAGELHVMGDVRRARWLWLLVSGANVIGRGEVQRKRDRSLDDVLRACARQGYVAGRLAS